MAQVHPAGSHQTGVIQPIPTPPAPPIPEEDPNFEKYRKLTLYIAIAETALRIGIVVNVLIAFNMEKVLVLEDKDNEWISNVGNILVYIEQPLYGVTAAAQAYAATSDMIERNGVCSSKIMFNYLISAAAEFLEIILYMAEPSFDNQAPRFCVHGIGEAGKGVTGGMYAFYVILLLLKIPQTGVATIFYFKLSDHMDAAAIRRNIPDAVNRDMSVRVFKPKHRTAEGGEEV